MGVVKDTMMHPAAPAPARRVNAPPNLLQPHNSSCRNPRDKRKRNQNKNIIFAYLICAQRMNEAAVHLLFTACGMTAACSKSSFTLLEYIVG